MDERKLFDLSRGSALPLLMASFVRPLTAGIAHFIPPPSNTPPQVLLCTNIVLIKRLGKAYKAAAQQMQQHMTALPVTGYPHQGGVQMGGMGGGPPAGYPQGMGMQMGGPPPAHMAPQQPWGAAPPPAPGAQGVGGATTTPPAGYPSQFTPPVAGTNAV